VRADRLVSLVLLLQARGGATGRALAAELGVSVRTVYRDLEALGAAGVPVITESGPGGGCRLLDGYRFPLRGLRPEEAEALLILGVPAALRDLGLDQALSAAHRQIQATSGAAPGALVHLDLPRWFGSQEEVPCLRDLARALRLGRMLRLAYRPADGREDGSRVAAPRLAGPRLVGPLGLVNKAGSWYLVAQAGDGDPRVFRAGRIGSAVVLAEPFPRPPGFELAGFWARWSAEFEASRPRIQVTLRASPAALAAFAEIFGAAAGPALASAPPPGADGWRVVTLSFEHEVAAAYRLAGFGDQVEVLSPLPVRDRLVRTAQQILSRYGTAVTIPKSCDPRVL
jgi:predicted DNA-binding transcriptional regulator YafY